MASPAANDASKVVKLAKKETQNPFDSNSSVDGSSDTESDAGSESMEKLNGTLQDEFNTEMEDLAQKRDHASVGVLLLQWEPEDKGFMDTTAEVESLGRVFRDSYNFSTYVKSLNTRRNAEHQLRAHLSHFVLEEDSGKALLIVYYAGHGLKEKGKLWLQGGNPRKGKRKEASKILWEEVEQSLERAKADLLVIFDCCFAGILADDDPRRAPPSRIFEFLGATERNKTARGPGESSFTTALVWALQELAKEGDGFNTYQLWAKVRKAPNFRNIGQTPVYSPRGKTRSQFKLQMRPLAAQDSLPQTRVGSEVTPMEETKPLFLDLQFTFDRSPTKNHISALAESIKKAVKHQDLPIKQVQWRGLSERAAPVVPISQKDLAVDEVKLSLSDVAWAKIFASRRRRLSPLTGSQMSSKHSGRVQSKEGQGHEQPQISKTVQLFRKVAESKRGSDSSGQDIEPPDKERAALDRCRRVFSRYRGATRLLATFCACAILCCVSLFQAFLSSRRYDRCEI